VSQPIGPRRVAVRRTRRTTAPTARRPVAQEIDDQTGIGDVYMSSLIRTQLRLGLATAALVVVPLAALPILLGRVPALAEARIATVPLAWVVLGGLVYPTVFLVGRWYVRQAERTERRFTDLVGPR
jgi:hypothetical protein